MNKDWWATACYIAITAAIFIIHYPSTQNVPGNEQMWK